MKKNQKGFSTVEVLLIVVIVGMLGGIGYYVWHAQKQTDDTLNSTGKTSQNIPSAVQPKSSTNSTIFKFSNLGVQFTLPSSINNLQYTPWTFSDGGKGGYLTTTDIKSMINKCLEGQKADPKLLDATSYSFAGIGKVDGQYSSDQFVESQLLKQFSSFYLDISYPNGNSPCYPDEKAMDSLKSVEQTVSDTFIKAVQSTATEIK